MNGDEVSKAVTDMGVSKTITDRQVQTQGRIDIPNEWLDDMGLQHNDSVFLKYDKGEKEIKVFEVKPEMIER